MRCNLYEYGFSERLSWGVALWNYRKCSQNTKRFDLHRCNSKGLHLLDKSFETALKLRYWKGLVHTNPSRNDSPELCAGSKLENPPHVDFLANYIHIVAEVMTRYMKNTRGINRTKLGEFASCLVVESGVKSKVENFKGSKSPFSAITAKNSGDPHCCCCLGKFGARKWHSSITTPQQWSNCPKPNLSGGFWKIAKILTGKTFIFIESSQVYDPEYLQD